MILRAVPQGAARGNAAWLNATLHAPQSGAGSGWGNSGSVGAQTAQTAQTDQGKGDGFAVAHPPVGSTEPGFPEVVAPIRPGQVPPEQGVIPPTEGGAKPPKPPEGEQKPEEEPKDPIAGLLPLPENNIVSLLTPKTKTEKNPFTFTKKLGYSPGTHMVRLARLFRTTDVKTFIGGVNANMYLARNSSGADKQEIKVAVGQMQQVIQRARVKVRKLEDEAQLAGIQRRAVKRKATSKALQLEYELARKRTARVAREYGEAKACDVPKLDLVGVGRSPEEKWADTMQQTPGALLTPAIPIGINPSPEQAAAAVAAATAPVADTQVPTGTIDIYV